MEKVQGQRLQMGNNERVRPRNEIYFLKLSIFERQEIPLHFPSRNSLAII